MDTLFLKCFYPEIFLSLVVLYQIVANSRLINTVYNKYPLLNVELLWQGLFILICLFFLEINQLLSINNPTLLFMSYSGTQTIKTFLVFFSLLSFIFIWKSFIIQTINFFEYFSLFFLSLLGTLLLINTSDLISAYLVIELQALSFYVLACFKRTSSFSTEAGLKYFVLGSFISALFLMGSFFFYASLGTLNIVSISLLLALPLEDDSIKTIVLIGAILISVALLFKAAVAPFHFWAPDVYEGAPLSSTIIFSIVPKFSIFVFLLRCISIFTIDLSFLNILFILSGIFSVVWGAYFSLTQKRLKRFIIYSSISQVGFIIVACSSCNIEASTSIFFFLTVYLLSSLIVWGSLVSLFWYNKSLLNFDKTSTSKPLFLIDLTSYFKLNYSWSLMLLILFFSFAGIPPFSGFLSKLLIILSLILNKDNVVAVSLILASIISTYYYLRIIKILFFDKKSNSSISKNFITVGGYSINLECTILSLCTFLLIYIFFFPSFLLITLNTAAYGCLIT